RDPNVRIWDTTAWTVIRTFTQSRIFAYSIAFSPPDGKLLAVPGTSDGENRVVNIWDATTGQRIHQLHGHSWNIHSVAFDRTGQLLASASADRTVRVWDVRAGQELVQLRPEHAGGATNVAFSPDGKYLASGGMDRTLKIWDATNWKLLREIPDATGEIKS